MLDAIRSEVLGREQPALRRQVEVRRSPGRVHEGRSGQVAGLPRRLDGLGPVQPDGAARDRRPSCRTTRVRWNPLWTEYEHAVKDAQNVSAGDKIWPWLKDYNLIGGSDQPDYNRRLAEKQDPQISDVQNEYNIKAQVKAFAMAQEMFDTYSSFSRRPRAALRGARRRGRRPDAAPVPRRRTGGARWARWPERARPTSATGTRTHRPDHRVRRRP